MTITKLIPPLCAALFGLLPLPARAADFSSGSVKLTLYEDIGRFSLFKINGAAATPHGLAVPLFSERDPRSSYLAVMSGGKVYRMGESTIFKTRLEGTGRPVFIFESPFLRITERFDFIQTASSAANNGVRVTLIAENIGKTPVDAGFKLLLDTYLDEGRQGLPIKTNLRTINGETALLNGAADMWWMSGNGEHSLMGSVSAAVDSPPDLIHFSNWKRLDSVPWRSGYAEGRRFNYTLSIGDSAAAYFFEPVTLSPGERRVCELLLAAGDEQGFGAAAGGSSAEQDLARLKELIRKLNEYMAGGSTASESDIAAIEAAIRQLREKYR